MTLSEMIAQLIEIAESLNEEEIDPRSCNFPVDPEVCLATQPRYPLASHVSGVVHLPDDEVDTSPENPGIVWVSEGCGVYDRPYAPREAWAE